MWPDRVKCVGTTKSLKVPGQRLCSERCGLVSSAQKICFLPFQNYYLCDMQNKCDEWMGIWMCGLLWELLFATSPPFCCVTVFLPCSACLTLCLINPFLPLSLHVPSPYITPINLTPSPFTIIKVKPVERLESVTSVHLLLSQRLTTSCLIIVSPKQIRTHTHTAHTCAYPL